MTVQVVEDEVVITGPESLGVSLTPDAARISAERLLRAAEEASAARSGPSRQPD